jgi:hypothetical protein
MRLSALLTFLVAIAPTAALAWGAGGHSVVAELAERRLDPDVGQLVRRLTKGASLASRSVWADDYKFETAGEHTKSWHFANVDVDQTGSADQVDAAKWPDALAGACKDASAVDCLPEAITEQIALLSDASASDEKRLFSLLMVVHLVGDLSQPHHCATRKVAEPDKFDSGGNGVGAQFVRERDRTTLNYFAGLHLVWDDALLDAYSYGWSQLVDQIEAKLAGQTPPAFSTGDIDGWLRECHLAAKQSYAALPSGWQTITAKGGRILLSTDYQNAVKDTAFEQLGKGGLRLAAILNKALSTK